MSTEAAKSCDVCNKEQKLCANGYCDDCRKVVEFLDAHRDKKTLDNIDKKVWAPRIYPTLLVRITYNIAEQVYEANESEPWIQNHARIHHYPLIRAFTDDDINLDNCLNTQNKAMEFYRLSQEDLKSVEGNASWTVERAQVIRRSDLITLDKPNNPREKP